MSCYKDFIEINEKFQNAINLQLDLNNFEKIDSFIPTKAAVDVLKGLLRDVVNNTGTRSHVLIGPYGKGKSHLFLILLGILSVKDGEIQGNRCGKEVIDRLVERIESISKDTADIIRIVRQNQIRLLPVLVNSGYFDLKQAFLAAMKNSLNIFGLDDVNLVTYFEAIKEVIDRWKIHYKPSYVRFIEVLKCEYRQGINEFIDAINNYETNSYEIFCRIFPSISSGSVFNPLAECGSVSLFNDVNKTICSKYGYSGIYIVFDEFSKYLESSLKADISLELRMIQEFAENANGSSEPQLHLTCIAHKSIGEYTTLIPKRRVESYRAVEGRFKEIFFISSIESSYELIANTITKKKNEYEVFKYEYRSEFIALRDSIKDTPFFNHNFDLQKMIVEDCFPLNPLVSYALLQVCEKSAQNERTLFTFLSRKGEGLDTFIQHSHDGFQLLTIDYVYDYFESLFLKDIYNPAIRDYALYVKSVLPRLEEEERRFIKALAIILIIQDTDYFGANYETLCASMLFSHEEYSSLLNSLTKKGIIRQKRLDGTLTFMKNSSEDLRVAIHDRMEQNRSQINIRKELEESVSLGFVIPRKYNDKKEMVRYFRHIYITANELLRTNQFGPFYSEFADGYVLNLVYFADDDINQCIKKFYEIADDRVILRVSKSPFLKTEELLERYAVCSMLDLQEYKNDSDVQAELLSYKNDIESTLEDHIDQLYRSTGMLSCYYNGAYHSEEIISKLASEICNNLYSKTLIFKNEMINKRTISSQMRKAREKAINYIFSSPFRISKDELIGSSPDITILKALIEAERDPDSREIYRIIDEFIHSCDGKRQCIRELIVKLISKPYGLRDSIIPLLLAQRIKNYLADVTIYFNGKETPISGEVFSNIAEKFDQFYVLIDNGSVDRQDYVRRLSELFCIHYQNVEQNFNSNTNVVRAISNYIRTLPRFTREMARSGQIIFGDSLSDLRAFITEIVKADINPRDILFDFLPSIFPGDTLIRTLELIEKGKEKLDTFLAKYIDRACNNIKVKFVQEYRGSLQSALLIWLSDVPKENRSQIFDAPIPEFIKLIESPYGHDDTLLLNRISVLLTHFKVEDWTATTESHFWDELDLCRDKLMVKCDEQENNDTLEVILSINGDTQNRKLSNIMTMHGKSLLSNISSTLSEYADSVTKQEKVRVLLELLKKEI